MNLGQLIGELRAAAEEAIQAPTAEHEPVDGVPGFSRSQRPGQVLALVRRVGPIDYRHVSKALGVNRTNASQILHKMVKGGLLKIIGHSKVHGRAYVYDAA